MPATTLTQYLDQQAIDRDLATLIATVADSGREICRLLQQGALGGVLGAAGHENVQGEEQKKLDVIANELLKQRLIDCGVVRGIASEEEDEVVSENLAARYLVCYDPLDGSSNIDINAMVGTIFSVLESDARNELSEAEFLQPGRRQKAAGYVLYGPSTMLTLTVGRGVAMFTLDQGAGQFLLTRDNVRIEPDTKEFAINMSNQRFWAPGMQAYIADLLRGSDGPRGKNYNMRWVAAMVADVHRVLCRGGLFTYPWDSRKPDQPGKLRLMYEANPMGLLVEQAGGEVWTDREKILDIQPHKIHQRVSVILGAANEVKTCVDYHRNR